jgi:2-polyprenyl-3-methyl-5-hydroxy-6-metoxy-1,4-benzoquinol methylase
MDNFYSKPYFEILLKQATPEIKDWFQKEIEYLRKNIKPNSKILDVGCGFGRHMKILANFSNEVIGIDNNEDMIQKAKQNLSGLKTLTSNNYSDLNRFGCATDTLTTVYQKSLLMRYWC